MDLVHIDRVSQFKNYKLVIVERRVLSFDQMKCLWIMLVGGRLVWIVCWVETIEDEQKL